MASSLPLLLLVLCSLTVAEARLSLSNLRASGLRPDTFSAADGYVKVFCSSANLGTTSVKLNNPNPWWSEAFSYFDARQHDILKLQVFDRDLLSDDLLGVCQIQIKVGNYGHDCPLKTGGNLHYEYTLSV